MVLPSPIKPEALAMPGDHGFRFDDDQGRALAGHRAVTCAADLVTNGENLQLQGCPSPEGGADGAIHRNQQGEHGNGSLAAEPRQLQLI